MSLDVKRFDKLLEEGQRRRAELDKGIARLRADYEKAGAAVAALQKEKSEITRRLAAADKGELAMAEGEYAAAGDRLRFLTSAIARANAPWSDAEAALKKAENDARGVMQPLKNEAVRGYRHEAYEAGEAYEKAWLML